MHKWRVEKQDDPEEGFTVDFKDDPAWSMVDEDVRKLLHDFGVKILWDKNNPTPTLNIYIVG